MRFRAFGIALVAAIVAVAVHAQAPAPAPLRVIAFDGGWNLPLWAAQRQGFFETNGVSVQLTYTPTSTFLVWPRSVKFADVMNTHLPSTTTHLACRLAKTPCSGSKP